MWFFIWTVNINFFFNAGSCEGATLAFTWCTRKATRCNRMVAFKSCNFPWQSRHWFYSGIIIYVFMLFVKGKYVEKKYFIWKLVHVLFTIESRTCFHVSGSLAISFQSCHGGMEYFFGELEVRNNIFESQKSKSDFFMAYLCLLFWFLTWPLYSGLCIYPHASRDTVNLLWSFIRLGHRHAWPNCKPGTFAFKL